MTRPRHLHPILDDCVARRAVEGSSLKFEFDISPGPEKTRIAEHAALINIRQPMNAIFSCGTMFINWLIKSLRCQKAIFRGNYVIGISFLAALLA
jgi:hypothetical protein